MTKCFRCTIFGSKDRAIIELVDRGYNEELDQIGAEQVAVFAFTLPITSEKYDAFKIFGKQIYCGNSLKDCVREVQKQLQMEDVPLPKTLRRYL